VRNIIVSNTSRSFRPSPDPTTAKTNTINFGGIMLVGWSHICTLSVQLFPRATRARIMIEFSNKYQIIIPRTLSKLPFHSFLYGFGPLIQIKILWEEGEPDKQPTSIIPNK
jgi:hypothetical protein